MISSACQDKNQVMNINLQVSGLQCKTISKSLSARRSTIIKPGATMTLPRGCPLGPPAKLIN